MMAILTGVRWNLSVVLICISFMAGYDENFLDIYLTEALLFPTKNYETAS
jgi:hypothetical protein